MKYYIVHHKNGDINDTVMVEPGKFFDVEQSKNVVPGGGVVEIDKDVYGLIKGKQAHYRVKNGEVVEQEPDKLEEIMNNKEKWEKNNTISGLRSRIEELEKKFGNK